MVCALSVKNTAMLITSLLLSHYCRTALRPSPALEGVPGVASSFQASIPECHLPSVFAHCSFTVCERNTAFWCGGDVESGWLAPLCGFIPFCIVLSAAFALSDGSVLRLRHQQASNQRT